MHNPIKLLYELEFVTKESSALLCRLADNVCKHLRALETLQQPVEYWDPIVIFLISIKLDKVTAREWEKFKISSASLKLNDLKSFLYSRADFLEAFETKSTKEHFNNRGSKQYALVSTDKKCNYCKKSHLIYSCSDFLHLSIAERIEKIKQLKLCENCLCTRHAAEKCRSGLCKVCKKSRVV